jgi:hypothetical protein
MCRPVEFSVALGELAGDDAGVGGGVRGAGETGNKSGVAERLAEPIRISSADGQSEQQVKCSLLKT